LEKQNDNIKEAVVLFKRTKDQLTNAGEDKELN
jgi:hypothetical protein